MKHSLNGHITAFTATSHLLLLLLTILHLSLHVDSACPRGCSCLPDIEVSCDDKGFDRIPKLGADYARILSLDMSGNKLNSISETDFPELSSLEILDLSSNRISKVTSKFAFNKFQKLRKLHLDDNFLSSLPPRVFHLNPLLKHLSLSGNELDLKIPFLKSNSITTLDISNCTFQSVPSAFFAGLANLRTLDLSNNALTSLPDDFFSGLPRLQELFLRDNPWQCEQVRELLWSKRDVIADLEMMRCSTSDGRQLAWSQWNTTSEQDQDSSQEDSQEDEVVPSVWKRNERSTSTDTPVQPVVINETESKDEDYVESLRRAMIRINMALAGVIVVLLFVALVMFLHRRGYICRAAEKETGMENGYVEEDDNDGYLKPNVVLHPGSTTRNLNDNSYVENVYERIY